MVRRLAWFALGVVAVVPLGGCDDDAPPVSVPMSSPTPPEPQAKDTAAADPETADAAATGTPGGYRPGGGPGAAGTATAKPSGRSIHGCCDALDKAAQGASSDASRKLYEQATRVCYQKANQILQGKVTTEQALAQVRSSLIGAAPSQCY